MSPTQEDVLKAFHNTLTATHGPRAVDDILTTARIFLTVLAEANGHASLGDVLAAARTIATEQKVPWHQEAMERFHLHLRTGGHITFDKDCQVQSHLH